MSGFRANPKLLRPRAAMNERPQVVHVQRDVADVHGRLFIGLLQRPRLLRITASNRRIGLADETAMQPLHNIGPSSLGTALNSGSLYADRSGGAGIHARRRSLSSNVTRRRLEDVRRKCAESTTVFVKMNRTTPSLLRHWLAIMSVSEDLRLSTVLTARDRIRRGSYADEVILDRTVERLFLALT